MCKPNYSDYSTRREGAETGADKALETLTALVSGSISHRCTRHVVRTLLAGIGKDHSAWMPSDPIPAAQTNAFCARTSWSCRFARVQRRRPR